VFDSTVGRAYFRTWSERSLAGLEAAACRSDDDAAHA
jgi:hypothetical protein